MKYFVLSILLVPLLFLGAGCAQSQPQYQPQPQPQPQAVVPTPSVTINTKIPAGATDITQDQVDNLIKQYPNWGIDIYVKVAQKAVDIGMTKEQVLAAWGQPQKTSKLNDRGDETWSYPRGNSVTFIGDSVSSIGQ